MPKSRGRKPKKKRAPASAPKKRLIICPHRELVWVIFGQISSGCLLLLLSLWACGQRACVVHHVHSDAGCSSRGFVTRPWPAEPPTGSIGNDGRMPEIATGSAACR